MRSATDSPGAGGRGTPRPGRRFLAVLGVLITLVLGGAPPASAHPISTSAVLLDLGADEVTAKIELPLDELGSAFGRTYTPSNVLDPATITGLRSYVRAHMSATDPGDRTWVTTVTGGMVENIDGIDHLVLDATLTPSTGTVGDFTLDYDAVIDRLASHRVFVSARWGHSGDYTTLVMLSWQRQSVPVVSAAAPASTDGFLSAVQLGVEHISGGSDHLLFLIMLLLPAPLLAKRHRWVPRTDPRRAGWRVVHVVTAFAIGHSITLALGALGLVHLPTRLVESGIALSVLVSAIHAIRPLVRRGEVLIAGTFGLLHGLAFAALLGELDLSRANLVVTLLGFNAGIELTQLLVVALVMPSLIMLSRTVIYPYWRIGVAALGALLAAAWLAERTGITSTNPVEPVSDVLVDHPLVLAAGFAALALTAVTTQRIRASARPSG
ncbi:HupE/UreJ family protein [Amycolatopsis sp. NPDC051061]|uniref:HupE/UreJ family protein n=1 Tax=Amycolatopsis sp. NPDC051061 TaxID=3155042 RepID=UPI0034378E4A